MEETHFFTWFKSCWGRKRLCVTCSAIVCLLQASSAVSTLVCWHLRLSLACFTSTLWQQRGLWQRLWVWSDHSQPPKNSMIATDVSQTPIIVCTHWMIGVGILPWYWYCWEKGGSFVIPPQFTTLSGYTPWTLNISCKTKVAVHWSVER